MLLFLFFAPHAAYRARTGSPLLDSDRQMLKSEWRYKLGSYCNGFAACGKSVGCDPKEGVPLFLERFLDAEPLKPLSTGQPRDPGRRRRPYLPGPLNLFSLTASMAVLALSGFSACIRAGTERPESTKLAAALRAPSMFRAETLLLPRGGPARTGLLRGHHDLSRLGGPAGGLWGFSRGQLRTASAAHPGLRRCSELPAGRRRNSRYLPIVLMAPQVT